MSVPSHTIDDGIKTQLTQVLKEKDVSDILEKMKFLDGKSTVTEDEIEEHFFSVMDSIELEIAVENKLTDDAAKNYEVMNAIRLYLQEKLKTRLDSKASAPIIGDSTPKMKVEATSAAPPKTSAPAKTITPTTTTTTTTTSISSTPSVKTPSPIKTSTTPTGPTTAAPRAAKLSSTGAGFKRVASSFASTATTGNAVTSSSKVTGVTVNPLYGYERLTNASTRGLGSCKNAQEYSERLGSYKKAIEGISGISVSDTTKTTVDIEIAKQGGKDIIHSVFKDGSLEVTMTPKPDDKTIIALAESHGSFVPLTMDPTNNPALCVKIYEAFIVAGHGPQSIVLAKSDIEKIKELPESDQKHFAKLQSGDKKYIDELRSIPDRRLGQPREASPTDIQLRGNRPQR